MDKHAIIFLVSIGILFVVLIIGIFIVEKNGIPIFDRPEPDLITEEESEAEDDSVSHISEFDLSFLKLENDRKNIIYSPLSLKNALFMLRDGASGNTKDELDVLLKDVSLKKYQNVPKVLSLANGMFVRSTYKDSVKKEYIDSLKNNYNAEVNFDEFRNAQNINRWINKNTFGIIERMLEDDVVKDENLKLILINALAIDMDWANTFDENRTSTEKFYNGDETYDVNMMSRGSKEKYYIDGDVTATKLSLAQYSGNALEFVIIMPNDLEDYINNVGIDDINELLNKMEKPEEKQNVIVHLPRFNYEYNLDAKEDLKELGVKEVFDFDKANLNNISKDDLYLGDIKHKAKISVKERGVTAAAVSVEMYSVTSAQKPPKEEIDLRFDKPFMYLIKDKNSDQIWFVGTVYKPQE